MNIPVSLSISISVSRPTRSKHACATSTTLHQTSFSHQFSPYECFRLKGFLDLLFSSSEDVLPNSSCSKACSVFCSPATALSASTGMPTPTYKSGANPRDFACNWNRISLKGQPTTWQLVTMLSLSTLTMISDGKNPLLEETSAAPKARFSILSRANSSR